MRALHRRPLSPEYLAGGEFGPGTETAQFIVGGALYQSFANKESETVKTLLNSGNIPLVLYMEQKLLRLEMTYPN